jgi:hypothetical protein
MISLNDSETRLDEYLHRFVPIDVPSGRFIMPTSKPPMRWQCSYCKGLRLGEQCEGCGAPRHQGVR